MGVEGDGTDAVEGVVGGGRVEPEGPLTGIGAEDVQVAVAAEGAGHEVPAVGGHVGVVDA